MKKAEGRPEPRYTLYYSDSIEMNGKGIDYVVDNETQEEESMERGMEGILEDLYSTHMEFIDYEMSLYIGNASAFTVDIMVDYPSDTPSEAVDKVQQWLDDNVSIRKGSPELSNRDLDPDAEPEPEPAPENDMFNEAHDLDALIKFKKAADVPGSKEEWARKLQAALEQYQPIMRMLADASPARGSFPDPSGEHDAIADAPQDLANEFQYSVLAVMENGQKLVDAILTYNPNAGDGMLPTAVEDYKDKTNWDQ